MGRPILLSLSESQARQLLEAMLPHPDFSDGMEHIAGALARNWPAAVIDWLGRRLARRSDGSLVGSYDAIPYAVYDLKDPLAANPGLMLSELRQWFDADPDAFPYTGGRLLASVFPACPDELFGPIREAFLHSPETEAGYALAILRAYEGKPCIFELVRTIVASLPEGSPSIAKARFVLEEGGVITGEYGFVNRAQRRIELIEPWLSNENPNVRAFAAEYRRDLERTVVHETRRADQSFAMRRLAYGEDPVQSDAAAPAEE